MVFPHSHVIRQSHLLWWNTQSDCAQVHLITNKIYLLFILTDAGRLRIMIYQKSRGFGPLDFHASLTSLFLGFSVTERSAIIAQSVDLVLHLIPSQNIFSPSIFNSIQTVVIHFWKLALSLPQPPSARPGLVTTVPVEIVQSELTRWTKFANST